MPVGAHSLLKSIQTFDDLIYKRFPPGYQVPVTFSGPLADEMTVMLKQMDLKNPKYRETLGKDGICRMSINDAAYPAESRDLVAGILNPVEMINNVLAQLIQYRSKQLFTQLVNETNIECRTTLLDSVAVWNISLTPRGNRFNYLYKDLGVFVQEQWLVRADMVVDTLTRLTRSVTLYKMMRRFSVDQSTGPSIDSIRLTYQFSYVPFQGKPLPSRVDLSRNDTLALTLTALYRPAGAFVVFHERTLCYHRSGQASCLEMDYGDYTFGPSIAPTPGINSSSSLYAKNLKKAGDLSRKAADALKKGDAIDAVRMLQQLVELYPSTPQGVEAKKLLSAVPAGW